MAIDQLREIYQARPFQPFTVELAEVQMVPVHHSEFLSYHPRGRAIARGDAKPSP